MTLLTSKHIKKLKNNSNELLKKTNIFLIADLLIEKWEKVIAKIEYFK